MDRRVVRFDVKPDRSMRKWNHRTCDLLQSHANRPTFFAAGRGRMDGMVVRPPQIDFVADLNLRPIGRCVPDRIGLPTDLVSLHEPARVFKISFNQHDAPSPPASASTASAPPECARLLAARITRVVEHSSLKRVASAMVEIAFSEGSSPFSGPDIDAPCAATSRGLFASQLLGARASG